MVVIQQVFFYCVVEGGVVGDFFVEYVVVDVGVGIDVDQVDFVVFFFDCVEDWQGDGVVVVEGQWEDVVIEDVVVFLFDDVYGFQQVEGVDCDVVDVCYVQ